MKANVCLIIALITFGIPAETLQAKDPMAELAVSGFGELAGGWMPPDAWEVQLRRMDDGASTCIAISPTFYAGQEQFKFSIYFGDKNGVAFINDREILGISTIKVDFSSQGFDFNSIEFESNQSTYRYFNALSRPMTTKFISAFYQSDFMMIDANGPYLMVLSDNMPATREAMRQCEDYRIGRTLPD